MEIDNPILITGCPRSGASLVAGLVSITGIWRGNCLDKSPLTGLYENNILKNRINKNLLTMMGADSRGQFPLLNTDGIHVEEWVKYVKRGIEVGLDAEEYNGGPWFFKDSKLILLWPIWHDIFPQAKWIIINRNKEDIIASCMKSPSMDAFGRPSLWEAMVEEYRRRILKLKDQVNHIDIWPDRIILENEDELSKIETFIGLSINRERASKFVDKDVWRKDHGDYTKRTLSEIIGL